MALLVSHQGRLCCTVSDFLEYFFQVNEQCEEQCGPGPEHCTSEW